MAKESWLVWFALLVLLSMRVHGTAAILMAGLALWGWATAAIAMHELHKLKEGESEHVNN